MEVTLLDVANQISALAKRLDQFDGIESRLTAHVDTKLAAAVVELKRHAQIHKEELRDDVKKAAEGYDATLKKIDEELAALNKKVDTKFGDHDLVLANHNKRLTKLEHP
jgi:hypothetical protein